MTHIRYTHVKQPLSGPILMIKKNNNAVPVDHRVKLKECEKRDKYLDLWELKITVQHESDDYTNCNWCSWYCHQRIGTRAGELGNNGTGGDNPNYCIVEIGQNTEKSPSDLRRLAITQSPVKNHQLMLMWKTLSLWELNCFPYKKRLIFAKNNLKKLWYWYLYFAFIN